MAITVVNPAGDTATGAASITLNKPADVQTKDIIVAVLSIQDDVTISAPNDAPYAWVEDIQDSSFSGDDIGHAIFYKIIADAGAESQTDYAFTSVAAENWAGGIMILRGVDNETPKDIASTSQYVNNDLTPTIGEVTTVTNNALVLPTICPSLDTTSIVVPTNYTEEVEALQGTIAVGVASYVQAVAGLTGDLTWTLTEGLENTIDSMLFISVWRPEAEAAVSSSHTYFNTPQYSGTAHHVALGWTWGSGCLNSASGMRAIKGSTATWEWAVVSSSHLYWYPSGDSTGFIWVSGSYQGGGQP
jgi:hypothetical protein